MRRRWAQRREADREDRRQQGQRRRPNGTILARRPAEPEAGAEARCRARRRRSPAQPRAVVAPVAQVVDAAAASPDGGVRPHRRVAGVAHAVSSTRSGRPAAGARIAEQVLQALPALLDAHERQAQVGDGVADDVVRSLVVRARRAPSGRRRRAVQAARRRAPPRARSLALLDLDREHAGPLGEVAERRRAQQPAGIDGDEVVAHPLDLAQQVDWRR